MDDEPIWKQRIRVILADRFGGNMTAMSRAIGRPDTYIHSILSKNQEPRVSIVADIAKATGVSAAYLYGEERPGRMVPVVSYVGAGAAVYPAEGATIDFIAVPDGVPQDAVAARVCGDSMLPAYRDGDHIICGRQRFGTDIIDLIGRECIVRLSDDRVFLKVLMKTASGIWSLLGYNCDPILEVTPVWAAPVEWVNKSGATPRVARQFLSQ